MSRVARFHADRTNQKLYFVRLACQQAEQQVQPQPQQGAREAAVFHLFGAVQAYLQELGRYYRIHDLPRPTWSTLEAALAQRGQKSPELLLLQEALQHGSLRGLELAWQACQYAPEPAAPEPESAEASQLILKVTQSPLAWLPDVPMLREWRQALQELIEQGRAGMVEF